VAGLSAAARGAAAALHAAAWEFRRDAYARGWRSPRAVPARVVSIGNLTVGGAGKTTLALHLARRALARGLDAAVVCRRYRPGPGGEGDEEKLFAAALGAQRCFAGRSKRDEAARAAASGARLVLVDDGFSHWPLERDLDVVLLDRTDLLGGSRMFPAGRLREPLRALQRADVVVISRLGAQEEAGGFIEQARALAPAASFAAGRHRLAGVRDLAGAERPERGRAHLVTATGNPGAVEASASEAGFEPVTVSAYRDHHWFGADEARRELARAGDGVLLLTRKDAVRWPAVAAEPRVRVLDVEWEWVCGGAAVEDLVFEPGA